MSKEVHARDVHEHSVSSAQVTRLCRMHQLHSALAFLFTRALSDYAAPAAELLLAHAHSPPDSQGGLGEDWGMKTQTGYKLLVYLKCGICGEAFPPGGRFTACASTSKLFLNNREFPTNIFTIAAA